MNYKAIKANILKDLDLTEDSWRIQCWRVASDHNELDGSRGYCHWQQKFPRHESKYTIYIRDDLGGADFVRTMAHELRHVWQWEHYKDSWSEWDHEYSDRRSERDANEYAAAFVAQRSKYVSHI